MHGHHPISSPILMLPNSRLCYTLTDPVCNVVALIVFSCYSVCFLAAARSFMERHLHCVIDAQGVLPGNGWGNDPIQSSYQSTTPWLVTTNQGDQPSLMLLSAAGWHRLQLGVVHCDIALASLKVYDNWPTNSGRRFSSWGFLAIEDLLFYRYCCVYQFVL